MPRPTNGLDRKVQLRLALMLQPLPKIRKMLRLTLSPRLIPWLKEVPRQWSLINLIKMSRNANVIGKVVQRIVVIVNRDASLKTGARARTDARKEMAPFPPKTH